MSRSWWPLVVVTGTVAMVGGAVVWWALGGPDNVPTDRENLSDESPGDGADEAAVAGPTPQSVVAVQGPIEESASYVSVSWSHVGIANHPDDEPQALGYEVERDGEIIATTTVDDEPWDDMAVRDSHAAPGTRRYRVRARFDAGFGPWSEPVEAVVRTTAEVGPVFRVDDYQGTDLERAQQAVDDAGEAGGGVVQFGAAIYEFDDSLLVFGNGILLRGAGEQETSIRAAFPGSDDSCGRASPLLLFRGRPEEMGVFLSEGVDRGTTSLRFNLAPQVEVGDFVEVNGVPGQLPIDEYTSRGVAQDPTIPRDERYPFDAGTVVAVDGTTILLDHPISPRITAGAELYRYRQGVGNGVELLSVEGRGPDDESYHRLIDILDQVDFRLAQVTARWGNRNFVDASGHNITLVGLTAVDAGAAGYTPEACKYKVGFGPATNVALLDSTIGSTDHDRNMSLVTMQFVYRGLVRNTTLGQSRTYGFNEHGGGSRDLVVENNWIGAGPSGWSGVLLGNDTWGFGGETAIRNNRFLDNVIDVLMVENPYGVVVAGNRSQGCREWCVSWSGWGGVHDGDTAIADPANYGSARLSIVGNSFLGAQAGLDLGAGDSNGFPWVGIRDVLVADNVIEVVDGGVAVQVRGDAVVSGRLWLTGSRLDGAVDVADPGPDWWMWDNTSGPETGDQPLPDWFELYQWWENPGGSP